MFSRDPEKIAILPARKIAVRFASIPMLIIRLLLPVLLQGRSPIAETVHWKNHWEKNVI